VCDLHRSSVRSRAATLGLASLSLLYALVCTPGWTYAQVEIADASARAQELFAAALAAKRAADPTRALCLMEQARAAWPHAAFSFNVAQLQRELGMCAEARQNYQLFLAHERDPARRKEAQLALAELSRCKPIRGESSPEAASARCSAWMESALKTHASGPDSRERDGAIASQARVLAPARVASTQTAQPNGSTSAPLLAAAPDAPSARRIPLYLPWFFAGVAVVCAGLSGYELTQIAAAERDIAHAQRWTPELSVREQDGRNAQTLSWIFGGAGVLALTSAAVLAIAAVEDRPPKAAGTR
jgi:hypothetical protein